MRQAFIKKRLPHFLPPSQNLAMSSIKCPRCNLTNWVTAPTCKRCGSELAGGGEAYSPGFEPAGCYTHSTHPNAYGQNQKSGLAIASMVLGILSVFLGCLGGFLLSPIGLILGIVSLVKSNRRPMEYGGKGFAIAGTVLSCVGLASFPIVAAIAIPNLLASRRAANEGAAIASIRKISAAEQIFVSTNGGCADLTSLASAKLIDPVLASGQKSGYRFAINRSVTSGSACEIHATPIDARGVTASGSRSFFLSTADGVIRASRTPGKTAGQSDAPIDTTY